MKPNYKTLNWIKLQQGNYKFSKVINQHNYIHHTCAMACILKWLAILCLPLLCTAPPTIKALNRFQKQSFRSNSKHEWWFCKLDFSLEISKLIKGNLSKISFQEKKVKNKVCCVYSLVSQMCRGNLLKQCFG